MHPRSRPPAAGATSSVASRPRCGLVPKSKRVHGEPGCCSLCAISLIWWPVGCALAGLRYAEQVVVVMHLCISFPSHGQGLNYSLHLSTEIASQSCPAAPPLSPPRTSTNTSSPPSLAQRRRLDSRFRCCFCCRNRRTAPSHLGA